MRVGLLIIISIFLSLSTALADSVHVKAGNVYYENNGKELQITSSGRDRDPVLHPDGTWVYFVRKLYECPTEDKCIPLKGINMEDGNFKEELWRIKTNGNDANMLFFQKKALVSLAITTSIPLLPSAIFSFHHQVIRSILKLRTG